MYHIYEPFDGVWVYAGLGTQNAIDAYKGRATRASNDETIFLGFARADNVTILRNGDEVLVAYRKIS